MRGFKADVKSEKAKRCKSHHLRLIFLECLLNVRSAEDLNIEVIYDLTPSDINGIEEKMKKAEKTVNLLRKIISIDLIS